MKGRLAVWWSEGVPPGLKAVYLILLANGLPAFVVLTIFPGRTEDLFVWTIRPEASAHLVGVMYGNALLLVVLGMLQPSWQEARVTLVLIAFFAVAATIVTLVTLEPFLKHPWVHLAYWLVMYAALFVAAPAILVRGLRRFGLRLAVEVPLRLPARATAALAAAVLVAVGVALLVSADFARDVPPWSLTPLVGRIVGVWMAALGLAYAWTAWDGDWTRTRLIFVQGLPTGAALAILPLVHESDLRPEPATEVTLYLGLAGLLVVVGALALALHRGHRLATAA